MLEASNELVSIIIPAYNSAEYIEETVVSALASTYPLLEIIIANDGSKDNTQEVIDKIVSQHPQIKSYQQTNQGASAARNLGILKASGKYILPLDADDIISPDYIQKAVEVLRHNKNVKVVYGNADFIGDRSGEWKLRPFNIRLLARKNMIYVSGMYRKSDYEKTDGYCPAMKGREDWDFWISMLKTGGDVVRLTEKCLYYRIHNDSNHLATRSMKKQLIDVLNSRHKAFFYRELGGKLHYNRTWSRLFNFFIQLAKPERFQVNPSFIELEEFVYSLPERFEKEGNTIHAGRNTIKVFEEKGEKIVVKSFRKPIFVNQIIYGIFRASKARRSYEYAQKLLQLGIGTPQPIGYYEQRNFCLFSTSYYISFQSECDADFRDLINNSNFANRNHILKAIARFTAQLHEKGIWHRDYSAGNILFRQKGGEIQIEILDLNRMDFGKIDLERGCRNFERLNIDEDSLQLMATEYAAARGFDKQTCIDLILQMRWSKHQKNNI
jgi:glycosyltransferase involved in cell wall biosynthesis